MQQLPMLHAGRLHVLLYTYSPIQGLLLELAANLALRGPLLVLDGGNRFNVYPVAQALRRQGAMVNQALQDIRVGRAFTCFQMAAMLAQAPSSPMPVLVLDLLTTFQDENIPLGERQRLLASCLPHLKRLCAAAAVLISARPGEPVLTDMLAAAADEIWQVEPPAEVPTLRLFSE